MCACLVTQSYLTLCDLISTHLLLQGLFLIQGLKAHFLYLLHWQVDSLSLSHLGSPITSHGSTKRCPRHSWPSNQVVCYSLAVHAHSYSGPSFPMRKVDDWCMLQLWPLGGFPFSTVHQGHSVWDRIDATANRSSWHICQLVTRKPLCGHKGFPGGVLVKNMPANAGRCKRHQFDPWVGKTPWRRTWRPTAVFSPGEFHGQRSLAGYSL